MNSLAQSLQDNYEQDNYKQDKTSIKYKISSLEFNIKFEKNIIDILTTEYKVTYYGIYNLKEQKIVTFRNSDIATQFIKSNLIITDQHVDIVEYISPLDILLHEKLENGSIEINVNYKNIPIFNDIISLDDYKHNISVTNIKKFIQNYKQKLEEYYLICLAHIFETMKMDD